MTLNELGRSLLWPISSTENIMKIIVLLILSLLTVVLVFLQAPIPQDPLYHQFADQREFSGIPNVLNVITNLPYLIFGIMGVKALSVNQTVQILSGTRYIYQVFFIAVCLIGVGSGYYHLSPDNASLFWDRLPISIAFMSFFTIVVAEYIDKKLAIILFPLFLFVGLASVVFWYWTESIGQGDLRPYILVQLLPIVLMLAILLMYKPCFSQSYFFWLVLVCYALAKVFEVMDAAVFELLGVLSGHTLKHLVSSVAPLLIYITLNQRKRV